MRLEEDELCTSKDEARNRIFFKVATRLLEESEFSPNLFWMGRKTVARSSQCRLNYKGAEFYPRLRDPTLGLPLPGETTPYHLYEIKLSEEFPFRRPTRTIGLALSG